MPVTIMPTSDGKWSFLQIPPNIIPRRKMSARLVNIKIPSVKSQKKKKLTISA